MSTAKLSLRDAQIADGPEILRRQESLTRVALRALLRHRTGMAGLILVLILLIFSLGAPLLAQDPFGDPAAPESVVQQPPPVEEAVKQGAVPQKAPAAGPAKKAEPPVDPSQYILPIRAVLQSNPQTPVELMRAITVLVDLDEPELARPYVSKLHAAALDDAALADLVRRVGSGPFLRIAAEKALEPEGREFGERAINAAGRHARDVPITDKRRNAACVGSFKWTVAQSRRAHLAIALHRGLSGRTQCGSTRKKGDVMASPFRDERVIAERYLPGAVSSFRTET